MDKENINLNCVKCGSFSSTKWRKITAYMLEQLPKNPEQRITRSKNLLCEGDLLCHKCYMYYLRNPVTKAEQQEQQLKQKQHVKLPPNASSRRTLIPVQSQPRALRSTHIAIPIDVFEQQRVELVSLHNIVEKQQSELDFLHEQILRVKEQLANEMRKCSEISKDISIFSPLFQNCVKKMTDILYRLQRHQNGNGIYDPEDFLNTIAAQAPELRQFFDMLYQSTNPTGKCEKTNVASKGRIVVLCYQLASLRNKQMTLLKRDAGLFFQHSGLSKKGINTLSNMGISTTFKTINQTRVKIKDNHCNNFLEYFQNHIEFLCILNVDDYHDIYEARHPATTSLHHISHMAIIIVNIPPISAIKQITNENFHVHNPLIININALCNTLTYQYMSHFGFSYTDRRLFWYDVPDITKMNPTDLEDWLTVHVYDPQINCKKNQRSMKHVKLVDLIPLNLKSTKQYLEALQVLFNIAPIKNYLQQNVIPVPADFPGQVYIRSTIIQKLKGITIYLMKS